MIKKERKRRKDARPSEILEAGFHEFSQNGFDRTKLYDVATRAGIAKGTLYLYYKSKEELFESAVQSRITPILSDIDYLIDNSSESAEYLLKKILKMMYQRIANSDVRTIIKIIIAEGDRFPKLTEFYYHEFISKIVSVLEKIIKRGLHCNEFKKSPATQLPQVLIAPAIMAAIWQITFASYKAISLDQFLEAHIDLIMNGIKK